MHGISKPTHVPQHHQDVLINRVDVEKVVLHLPDDACPGRHQFAQNAQLTHGLQCVINAMPAAQKFKAQRAAFSGSESAVR